MQCAPSSDALAEGEVQVGPVFGQAVRDFEFKPMRVGVDQRDGCAAGLQNIDDLLEDQGEGFFRLFGIGYEATDSVERIDCSVLGIVVFHCLEDLRTPIR